MVSSRLSITVDGFAPNTFTLIALKGDEGLSQPFQFELQVITQSQTIAPHQLIGRTVSFQIHHVEHQVRQFHGIIAQYSKQSVDYRGYQTYMITVVPWLHFLKAIRDCQIYQHLSMVEIVTHCFDRFQLTDYNVSHLTRTYPKIDYLTQYNESYFDFIHRCLQTAGIFYYFAHTDHKHELILSDQIQQLPLINSTMALSDWSPHQALSSNRVTCNDYDFNTPNTDLTVNANTQIQSTHIQGVHDFERYHYPGQHQTCPIGQALANQSMASENWQSQTIQASGNDLTFFPGKRCQFSSHQTLPQSDDIYLITHMHHEAHDDSNINDTPYHYHNEFQCIPHSAPFAPHFTIPHPTIRGTQTAIVTGVQPETPECDACATVTVKFHWDRSHKQHSLPIRVVQPNAGGEQGIQYLPRVGTEVLVHFEHGDPDRPIITGMLYNETHLPPYQLPEQKAMSGIKSRTIASQNPNDANAIQFDDTPHHEKLYLQAQNCFEQSITGNYTSLIQSKYQHAVNGNQTIIAQQKIVYYAEQGLILNAGLSEIQILPDVIRLLAPAIQMGMPGPVAASFTRGNVA